MVVDATVTDLVTLGAHLDGRNVATVRTTLNEALETATGDIVVDMGLLQLIDAAGLGMLTAAHLRAERSGQRLVLQNCSKEIRRVLAVTRLNRILRLDRG
ncbi:MAG: STAS domain-containing protein [Actinomycetota bacterium]|jgi:anti-anti-sigma factor|nr:STAS domain-containing protein [Actinomycetota bacterium]